MLLRVTPSVYIKRGGGGTHDIVLMKVAYSIGILSVLKHFYLAWFPDQLLVSNFVKTFSVSILPLLGNASWCSSQPMKVLRHSNVLVWDWLFFSSS